MQWEDKYKEAWAAVETKPSSGPRIPDGKNRVVVVDAAYDEKLRAAKWILEFPDAGSKRLTKTNFLFNKDGTPQFQWTHQDLATLGVPDDLLKDMDQLDRAMEATIGVSAQVTLQTPAGGKYSNIYFNHRLPDGEVVAAEVPADW